MAKKSRTKSASSSASDGVGPRQPCPCGSGRRYKACHGNAAGETPYIVRTFEGLPGECDWVALREFVPAGTAPLTLEADAYDGEAADRTVMVASVLPGISPAMVRNNGDVWMATQVAHQSADPSRDFAEAMRLALAGEPGSSVVMAALPRAGPRLQDVVDLEASFEVTVLDGFDFWFDDVADTDGSVAATLENLNSSIDPTARLDSVEAAYWTSVGTKEHLRWAMPHDEELLLTALSRLHVAGADRLNEESRLVGSFRAHGLLVPVWDLPVGTGASALEEPAAAFAQRLGDALAATSPLAIEERSARNGLANRQVTIR
ncbi:MAG: SEC-C domain-containing protein [Actinomycetota bacterium]|nr:SEC-C domain-containing protein [Nocardioidaceae bacterium]MDQ3480025.1 SEC-C domain-containing protein [Actinomycetota bacterium]